MEAIHLIARFKIHDGKLDEFKDLAQKCIVATRKEEGNMQYDYYFNPDESECVILEKYKNSDAVLAHMGNLGELLGQLLATSDFVPEVYGNPSETLVNAAASLNPLVYTYFKGK